jgi:hypothetical protein
MPSLGYLSSQPTKSFSFQVTLASLVLCSSLICDSALSASITDQTVDISATYPLLADSRIDNWKRHEPNREKSRHREKYRHEDKRYAKDKRSHWKEHERNRRYVTPHNHPARRDRVYVVPPRYHHRDKIIVRPFRHRYPRYDRHYHSHYGDVWGWLAFTAITLTILDNLNDQQQRAHEMALYNATAVPLGETIYWREGNAAGSVTALRDGTSSAGRYCREFQHEVEIGGKRESLYGTACQNPDGSWEIVE